MYYKNGEPINFSNVHFNNKIKGKNNNDQNFLKLYYLI